MDKKDIRKWIYQNLVMREEAEKITGQSTSAFGQSVSLGKIKPFVEFGHKRKTRLYLKEELEEYKKNKRKRRDRNE